MTGLIPVGLDLGSVEGKWAHPPFRNLAVRGLTALLKSADLLLHLNAPRGAIGRKSSAGSTPGFILGAVVTPSPPQRDQLALLRREPRVHSDVVRLPCRRREHFLGFSCR